MSFSCCFFFSESAGTGCKHVNRAVTRPLNCDPDFMLFSCFCSLSRENEFGHVRDKSHFKFRPVELQDCAVYINIKLIFCKRV
jgi:hypothetical protein